jgi:hypothetical protein
MSVKSLKRHEGWLLIDHRASPGIPADIARKIGFRPEDVAEGALLESATNTCSHCGNAYRMNRYRIRPREYCGKCDHYICDGCYEKSQHADYVHVPFKALIFEPHADHSAPRIIVP